MALPPAPTALAPPSFDRAFIDLEDQVRELLSCTAALEADIENVEQQVLAAEQRRTEAAARRQQALAARERHRAEWAEAQEELRAGTWQPAGAVPGAVGFPADDQGLVPSSAAADQGYGATSSISVGALTGSDAPSTRAGTTTQAQGPAGAAGGVSEAPQPPPQPLTQRLVNERCRDVLRILRDISEASRSMPDRDEGFTALLRESYKGLLTALKAAIPPSNTSANASGPAAAGAAVARGQGRGQAGSGTAAAPGAGAAARPGASVAEAGGPPRDDSGSGDTGGGGGAGALNREPLQRAVAAKRLYQQQQQQQSRAVRSRSASPPPGPGTALYSGLPPLRVGPGGQAAAPPSTTAPARQPGAAGRRDEKGESQTDGLERQQPQRQHPALGAQAAGTGRRPSGSGPGVGARTRRADGGGSGATQQRQQQLYDAARGPSGTVMAQSLLQPLLQQPDPDTLAEGGHEEEADWDWHWQEAQAEAVEALQGGS